VSEVVEVFVYLPEELVDVWAPVLAEHLFDDVYRIADQPYDPSLERWEFVPGEEVVCRERMHSDQRRKILVAERRYAGPV
jgi:hypothetical protein